MRLGLGFFFFQTRLGAGGGFCGDLFESFLFEFSDGEARF